MQNLLLITTPWPIHPPPRLPPQQELQRAHEEELREQEQRLSRWAEEEVAGVRELLTLQHSKELERLAADHQQQKRVRMLEIALCCGI